MAQTVNNIKALLTAGKAAEWLAEGKEDPGGKTQRG
jgi:hypothetical protein